MIGAMLVLAIALVVICFFTGVVLIWIGSTAALQYPYCRCGYDLRHLPDTSICCPECGRPRVMPGSRRTIRVTIRHPRMLDVGICLVVLPFAIAGLGIVLMAISAKLW